MRQRGVLIVLVSVWMSSVNAADLLTLFREAEQHDPILAAAHSAQAAAQEKRVQGEALLKPSIGLNSAWNQNLGRQTYYTPTESAQDLNYRQWNAAVNLNYPLYRPGNSFQAEQGNELAQQGDLQLELSRQDLMVRVAQAYVDQRISEEAVEVLDAQRVAIEQQLKLAKKNFQVGNSTIVDTHEAQSRYDQIQAQLTAARLDVQNKKVVLQNLIGHSVPTLEPLRPTATLPTLKFSTLNEWLEVAYAQHPSMKSVEKGAEVARLEYKKNQAAQNPTVDLGSQLGWNQAAGTDSLNTHYRQHVATIGVQVNYPIYSGGALDSRSRETASLYDKALSDVSATRLGLSQSVQQAWNVVQSLESQVHALEQAVTSSESVLKSSQRGQEVGVRTNIDVLNAQQLRAQSQRDLSKARYDRMMSVLRLYAVAGVLDIETLTAINGLLGK